MKLTLLQEIFPLKDFRLTTPYENRWKLTEHASYMQRQQSMPIE